ncbi:MAG: hypothetical protein ACTHMS_16265 [Jatrophihabitans sp.]|uniref:hypothetical protein n=1 Tax=Jatrophihabitans sp. TaxID=1932789 RepID=UPI003F7F4230
MGRVEFLDDAGSDLPVEEELTGGLPRGLGWLFGVGALVLVVVLSIVATHDGSKPKRREAIFIAPSPSVTTSDDHRFDQPLVDPARVDACPKLVLCSRLDHVSDNFVAAVREALPAARPTRALNVEFVRKGDFGLSVWYRKADFVAGARKLTVIVQQVTPDDQTHEDAYTIGRERLRRVERVLPGRTVIVIVSGGGRFPSFQQMEALAFDLRLITV